MRVEHTINFSMWAACAHDRHSIVVVPHASTLDLPTSCGHRFWPGDKEASVWRVVEDHVLGRKSQPFVRPAGTEHREVFNPPTYNSAVWTRCEIFHGYTLFNNMSEESLAEAEQYV